MYKKLQLDILRLEKVYEKVWREPHIKVIKDDDKWENKLEANHSTTFKNRKEEGK